MSVEGIYYDTIKELEQEIAQLKEKLKFYLEPFELRPTYQELEKKLTKIKKHENREVTKNTYLEYGVKK